MMASRYQAAIPPSISNLDVKVSSDVATLCREASTEVTRFGTELGTELGPFASILLRSGSASSSQIEQLTASAERVLMAEAGDTSRKNATLIASNTAAMRSSLSMADDLTSHSILDMHSSLLGDRHPERAGKWCIEPVWIGGSATSPQRASFVPPYHERVRTLIDDLIRFAQRTDIDPLANALLAHAQFETIHPFPDGNGRTGRALIHAMPRRDRLTPNVTVPVSSDLLTEIDRYFDALGAHRNGDPNPIIEIGAHASLEAIDNRRQLATEMREARTVWAERAGGVRSDSVAWKVINSLIEHPVVATALDRFAARFGRRRTGNA